MAGAPEPKAPSAVSRYLRWAYRAIALLVTVASLWLVGATARELYAGAPASTRSGVALGVACFVALLLPLLFEQRVTAAFRRRDPSAESVRASALFVWNAAVLAVLLVAIGTTSRRALYREGAWPGFGESGEAGLLGMAGRQAALWIGHEPLGSGCELEVPPAARASGAAPSASASTSASVAASASGAAPSASPAKPIAAPPPVVPERDFAPDELFAARSDAVVLVRVSRTVPPDSLEAKLFGVVEMSGHGSGFFVDGSGLIVTNAHVVEGATRVLVRLRDGRQFDEATLELYDRARDLALLSVGGEGLPYAPLADGEVKVGARALAIGSPRGLDHSLTDGIVSAERKKGGVRMLQFQSTIAPGSSGGPLFDARGRVIGVTTATEGAGLNYAVHAAHVRELLTKERTPKPLAKWTETGVVEDFALRGAELLPTDRDSLEEGARMLAQAVGSCLRTEGPPTGKLRWSTARLGAEADGMGAVLALLQTKPTIDLDGPSKECVEKLSSLVATQLGAALHNALGPEQPGSVSMSFRVRGAAPEAGGAARTVDVLFELVAP